ncbi:transcriptional regulator with XRE-family HTH domain [Salirhabdus euzebyi]|uniref:Transcriptional regulator with XRE-family HTH domain n=1 Tax=Salirhabdus euzebyi TaxID=394506 RepID=A0A841Q828_9BACI|nr:helix-turn-helix domain-containing protein [Salirhabdus euzebyi]MBB6454558.1 transcriptional regulator with XRE-family HTH domain [Salirhabdus euzebyi]
MKEKDLFGILLGRKIRYKREYLGLSRYTIAEQADLSENYLGLIERGHKIPGSYTLYRLSKVLCMSEQQLFNEIETDLKKVKKS